MNLNKLYLTKNECYIAGAALSPKGVMLHSTAANNPNLRRYVGPDDGRLGVNANGNHWNQPRPDGKQKCVHAFIGRLADGSVATYQTLPWDMRGWHGGGIVNNTHIGFEICEDDCKDPAYFAAVYKEAAELTAHLCRLYNLDPLADGVVICHSEGYTRGIASNHSDVMHWFPKFGKSMDMFRADVVALLAREGAGCAGKTGAGSEAVCGTEGDEVVSKAIMLFNGKEVEVERIFKDNTNYIKLRELEKLGMKVEYDEVRRMPVVRT